MLTTSSAGVVASQRVTIMATKRMLKDVPFEEIQLGDSCISYLGTLGYIMAFDPIDNKGDRGWITIIWDNGKHSTNHVFLDGLPWLGDTIEYVGR